MCSDCISKLPITRFWIQKGNPVEQLFWGRVKIEHAASFLYFEKGSKYQNLLHQIKYHDKKELAIWLGTMLGKNLINSNFKNIDCIIPVPLHKKKKRERGFNQSELIGKGISKAMQKPMLTKNLYRESYTKTQTKQTRYNRWLNVRHAFTIKNPDMLCGKHILLVDDIITTGATTEAIIQELQKIPQIKISVAVLASA